MFTTYRTLLVLCLVVGCSNPPTASEPVPGTSQAAGPSGTDSSPQGVAGGTDPESGSGGTVPAPGTYGAGLQVQKSPGAPGAVMGLQPLAPARPSFPLLDLPAPPLSAQDPSGATPGLVRFSGKVVVLNFWATWCPPCVEELPSLDRLRRQVQPEAIEVLAVSVDDSWAEVNKLLAKKPVSFPILLDTSRASPNEYGTEKFPETFIINKKGIVVRKLVGAQIWDRGDFLKYLRELARIP